MLPWEGYICEQAMAGGGPRDEWEGALAVLE
jgi:hypothetical protein